MQINEIPPIVIPKPFQPVVITLETVEELKELKSVLGASNKCAKMFYAIARITDQYK